MRLDHHSLNSFYSSRLINSGCPKIGAEERLHRYEVTYQATITLPLLPYLHFFRFSSSIRSFTGLTGVDTGELSLRHIGLALLLPSSSIKMTVDLNPTCNCKFVIKHEVPQRRSTSCACASHFANLAIPPFHSTIPFHRSSPLIVDYHALIDLMFSTLQVGLNSSTRLEQ